MPHTLSLGSVRLCMYRMRQKIPVYCEVLYLSQHLEQKEIKNMVTIEMHANIFPLLHILREN